jgi:hypothetical protein
MTQFYAQAQDKQGEPSTRGGGTVGLSLSKSQSQPPPVVDKGLFK